MAAVGMTAAGCGSSSDDLATIKPGSGVALNPGGKPLNQQQAAYTSQMQKAGDSINAQRAQMAAAMEAARQRAGGK